MNILNSKMNVKYCSHKLLKDKLFLIRRAYFYCYKCGKLIIIKNLEMYESNTEGKLEYNPIKVINKMLSNQESNINKNNSLDISDIYIKNRDIFIHYIKYFCRKMNYSKYIFYSCLNLIDNYLIHEIKKEISKRTIALITLGFFLITAKFYENDIYEPKLEQFCKIDKDTVISKSEIINSEIKALQMVNYNMNNYSVYDWLKVLNKVGYIFNGKINKLKYEQIKDKQKLLLKRIIYSNILYRYDSFQIALSIIHISMDNIFYTDKTSKELFDLFLTIFSKKFSDYEYCYIEIKTYIFNDFHQRNKEDEKNIIILSEHDKTRPKNLIHILSSIQDRNKHKSKNIKSEKILSALRKKIPKEEYNKKTGIEKYISKLTTVKQKPNYNDIPKDLLTSFSSISDKHLTIDCSKNNININTNKNNKHQNKIINNYVLSDNVNNRINIDINHLLKKSRTSLSNSPCEYFSEDNKVSTGQNPNNKNDKNIYTKFQYKSKNENKIRFNNLINIKGSMKLICKKNQIKNIILKKDGFVNWRQERNKIIQNNADDNNHKENAILKKNKTDIILPKFNN